MGSVLSSEPWRPTPKNNQENLKFVKSYRPRNNEANHLRILIHGPIGAGKSSFINSVDSILRGTVSSRALTDAISGSSFTKHYKTYQMRTDSGSDCSFVFNDIMGFEKEINKGVHVEDVKLVLKGHVREGYEFIPDSPMRESDQYYEPSPALDDRVHVMVSVVPADTLSIMSDQVVRKMREVRLAASDLGVPQLVILTKIDQACPKVQQNVENAYRSKYLKEQVDNFSANLGIPVNCVFLVRNCDTEVNPNDDINALILMALRQMIDFGDDFLNDL